MNKKMIICRCEEVSLSDISASIENGAETLKTIKMETRAGMGICQGRTCRVLLEQAIVSYTNKTNQEAYNLSYTNPARPVSLGNLAQNGKDPAK